MLPARQFVIAFLFWSTAHAAAFFRAEENKTFSVMVVTKLYGLDNGRYHSIPNKKAAGCAALQNKKAAAYAALQKTA